MRWPPGARTTRSSRFPPPSPPAKLRRRSIRPRRRRAIDELATAVFEGADGAGRREPGGRDAAFRRALALRTRSFGERAAETARSLSSLSTFAFVRGRWDDSESWERRALAVRRDALPPVISGRGELERARRRARHARSTAPTPNRSSTRRCVSTPRHPPIRRSRCSTRRTRWRSCTGSKTGSPTRSERSARRSPARRRWVPTRCAVTRPAGQQSGRLAEGRGRPRRGRGSDPALARASRSRGSTRSRRHLGRRFEPRRDLQARRERRARRSRST